MSDKPLSLRLLKLLLAIWWWGLLVGGAAGLLLMATLAPKNLNFPMIGYASDIDTSTLTAEDRTGQKLAVEFDGPTRVKLFASLVDDYSPIHGGDWGLHLYSIKVIQGLHCVNRFDGLDWLDLFSRLTAQGRLARAKQTTPEFVHPPIEVDDLRCCLGSARGSSVHKRH